MQRGAACPAEGAVAANRSPKPMAGTAGNRGDPADSRASRGIIVDMESLFVGRLAVSRSATASDNAAS